MSQYFKVHPDNPQLRHVRHAVDIVRNGGVIAYPTDSGYALGSQLGDKVAKDRICRIRHLDTKHSFTLICCDLAQAGVYARFSTPVFRLIRANTPGPYTFVLRATREVPRRLMHPKRKTIGVRIPDHRITQALLEELGEPMFTTTLILPGEGSPMTDPVEIRDRLRGHVDLVIDGGPGGTVPTTLVDVTGDEPQVLREGRGDSSRLL